MSSFKEAREMRLLIHGMNVISDEELLLLLEENTSRNPEFSYSLCYGTDFVTTASVFSSFIWGVKLQHSAVAGSQLLHTLPSLAGNSSLCRRWQATLSTLPSMADNSLLLSKNWRLSMCSLRYDWSRRVARS